LSITEVLSLETIEPLQYIVYILYSIFYIWNTIVQVRLFFESLYAQCNVASCGTGYNELYNMQHIRTIMYSVLHSLLKLVYSF